MDLNQVSLIGRLTRDPELKTTKTGTIVSSFSIAVNDCFGDNAKVYFFNCESWQKTAEYVGKYLTKGTRVAIGGKIKQDSWDDNGTKKTAIKIVALSVQGLESKKKNDIGEVISVPQIIDDNIFNDDDILF